MDEELKPLVDWFDREQRDLPWRGSPSPYAVWVSEIMLQQTQVATVLPYFNRWMERFPTVEALASASLDEVVKMWEGLGYYSRARNLRTAAQRVVEQHGGLLPESEEELLALPGIGPYTAAAIRAFAFHRRAAAVDGNVMRVMGRYWAIEEPLSNTPALRHRIEAALPKERPWVATEGLIELGATLCSPRAPQCDRCPLGSGCQARKIGRQSELPIKPAKVAVTRLVRHVALIESQDALLVRRAPKGEVMADLYHFPYAEEPEKLEELFARFELNPQLIAPLSRVNHGFTRYRASLIPFYYRLEVAVSVVGYDWMDREELAQIPFCSGHREIYGEWTRRSI